MTDQLSISFDDRPSKKRRGKTTLSPDEQRTLERMVPVAIRVAKAAGPEGVLMEDIRVAAVDAGILTGQEGKAVDGDRFVKPRALSFLAHLPSMAGLVRSGQRRYNSMGNPTMVWLHPDHATQRRAG